MQFNWRFVFSVSCTISIVFIPKPSDQPSAFSAQPNDYKYLGESNFTKNESHREDGPLGARNMVSIHFPGTFEVPGNGPYFSSIIRFVIEKSLACMV